MDCNYGVIPSCKDAAQRKSTLTLAACLMLGSMVSVLLQHSACLPATTADGSVLGYCQFPGSIGLLQL